MNLDDLKAGRLSSLKSSDSDSVMNKFKLPAKENSGSAFISGDNIVTKTLKKINDSGSNPFGAGVNTSKKPAVEESSVQGSVAKKFVAMKPRLDADNDGFVSRRELVNRMTDNNIKDQEAALVGALLQNHSKVKRLSNDETTVELKGLSAHDLAALDKLPFDNKLRSDVENGYYYNMSKIHSAKYNHDNNDKLKLPASAADINYKDLMQGSAGDCYFLAALASLAQRSPQKIVDMIKDNKNGTYTVKFPEKAVTIKAPTHTELGLYAEGKAWVPIIEKAYAVMRNDNRPIAKMNPFDTSGAGSTLVGRSIKELTGNSYDADILVATPKATTREKLKNAVANNKLMVASISKPLPFMGKNELNMPDGHVYTVMDYNAKTDKVKLRNPWGNGEAQDKDEIARDGIDEGIFELSLDEFDKNFSRIAYES